MAETLTLWSHALAALLFAAVALWAGRSTRVVLPRWPLVVASAALAAWALAVAGLGGNAPGTQLAEGARTLALLGFMFALGRQGAPRAPAGVVAVYGVVVLVAAAEMLLPLGVVGTHEDVGIVSAGMLLRMMMAVGALVLLQQLDAEDGRGNVRLIAIGFAAIWLSDFGLAAIAYLLGAWPAAVAPIRGAAMVLAAALIGAAIQRDGRGEVRISHAVTYRSLSLVAIGAYFALLAAGTSLLGAIGGTLARMWQTAFVFGSAAAVLTLVATPWLRAWAKVSVAKHLFRHRYDYRAEWIRFTGTLGKPDRAAPLAERVVKAVADLTDSPAGLLLVPEGAGLGIGTGWNWSGDLPRTGADAAFTHSLGQGERIVELDRARRGDVDGDVAPQWLLDERDAWAVVPLLHLDTLVGAIVLARPPVDRALDWEDFDLLRIAGRQVASYLAEARAQEALAETERFDEFNRRFAFIVHDIKNLVSGLSLVARNAERHADNPAFRADMVATLQDSADKLNALLGRLLANTRAAAEPPVAIDVTAIAEHIAAARRAQHPVVVAGPQGAVALADPGRLEQLLGHLVQNAIDASAAVDPVTIAVEPGVETVTVSVIDRGCGMSPAFMRDRLFRPFASTKPGGFGIGAFEARQLAEGMGGRIEVESCEGGGSTFRVILPAALASRVAA
ncbi:PEP-CTERM system histidine kinase PrsK [Sphingomonas cannabina]|uniref:XrtA/PEP-CTERM system histidine kinase PrsK n=1 Tax=Sphingomonas cannabina TaxID=2899123 RepID=UPI001F19CD34|nr:XrtA/PEP-CTERM system histidine kinase PrsK [Sphingomonas cannabina]UIJ45960.1 PEP-CTERM system histidine kinase PrsK [Sphingomonas cannabina]